MDSGGLNEIIEIYSPQLAKNDFGEQKTEYVCQYSTRAKVIQRSGNRSNENQEIVYNYIKVFEIRYYHKVEEFDRIKFDSHFYRILNIDKNRELQKITIECEKINE
ncbi:phage head closure protein [bacterium]|nr:phage head closure protein [bacterium]